MYYFYVLYSLKDGRLYKGYSNKLGIKSVIGLFSRPRIKLLNIMTAQGMPVSKKVKKRKELKIIIG